MIWSLRAIDAHWCRLALLQEENYIPFSLEDSRSIILDIPTVEPPNPLNAGLDDGLDDELGGETEGEDEEDREDRDIDHEQLPSPKVGPIEEGEITETLRRVSQVLDIPAPENSEPHNGRSFGSLATKE